MQKIIFISLVLFSSHSYAENPLNFEYTIHCFMDESCQKNRYEWVAYDLSSQFTRTVYSKALWIDSIDAKALTELGSKNLFFMTLDNYSEQLDRFIELYSYMVDHRLDIKDPELRGFFDDLSYAWSALVIPYSFDVTTSELPSGSERESLTKVSKLINKINEIRSNQKINSEDLIVPANDEIVDILVRFRSTKDKSTEVTSINLSQANVFIISNESILTEVSGGIPNSISLRATNLDNYLYFKSMEQALKDLLEENLIEDQADSSQNPPPVAL